MWFFVAFCRADCDDAFKIDTTGQHHFAVVDGSLICLQITKPKTVLIFDYLVNASASVCLNQEGGECKNVGDIKIVNSTYNISGYWFGSTTGYVRIRAPAATNVKFSYAIFPDSCSSRLVTNQRDYSFKVSNGTLDNETGFCFFNAAYGSFNYKVNYQLGEYDYLNIKRNDLIPRRYSGNNRFQGVSSADDPALFFIEKTNEEVNISSDLNITVHCEDIIPETNITQFLNTTEDKFFLGEFVNDFPPPEVDDKYSNIISIVLIVIFSGCAVGCIIYRIISYCHKKKLREQRALEKASLPKKRYRRIIRNTKRKTDEDFKFDDDDNKMLDEDKLQTPVEQESQL